MVSKVALPCLELELELELELVSPEPDSPRNVLFIEEYGTMISGKSSCPIRRILDLEMLEKIKTTNRSSFLVLLLKNVLKIVMRMIL
ncbi:MAG: hypothetical protein HQ517_02110 [SAR324 cluster bacterium]|nr:hypothetical protein [SAR324 cluster bacterium]